MDAKEAGACHSKCAAWLHSCLGMKVDTCFSAVICSEEKLSLLCLDILVNARWPSSERGEGEIEREKREARRGQVITFSWTVLKKKKEREREREREKDGSRGLCFFDGVKAGFRITEDDRQQRACYKVLRCSKEGRHESRRSRRTPRNQKEKEKTKDTEGERDRARGVQKEACNLRDLCACLTEVRVLQ